MGHLKDMDSKVFRIFLCLIFMKEVVPGSEACGVGKLSNLESCTDKTGNVYRGEDLVFAAHGTVCVHRICNVLRHVECSVDGTWLEVDGQKAETTRDKTCIDSYEYTYEDKKTRKKRFLWGRRSPPPTTTPPPPECGAPGQLPTATVTTTKTSEGGVATYTCNQGYAHTAGDLTRTCQSNSQWSGTEPTCSYMNSCSSSPCVNGGTCTNIPEFYTCTCPEIWKGSRCEEVALVCARNPCVNHISCVDGSEIYSCVCKPGWSGQDCDIPVDCGHPGNVENCEVSVDDTTLGNIATYQCHEGYNMTSGNVTRECGTDGSWTGSQLMCVYAVSCNSGPCLNQAICTNLLGDFECKCETGWTGKTCDTDIQPPVVQDCPKDIRVNATEKTRLIEWTEPRFVDPMGTEMLVESNYDSPSYTFPWGDFHVQYTALKLVNGLSSECTFNISVRPTPCDPLVPPKSGAVICNNWNVDFGRICHIACHENYTIPPTYRFKLWWICGDDGFWSSQVPVPDCQVEVYDTEDIVSYDEDYADHVFASCDSTDEVKKLQSVYISEMKQHGVSEFCDLYSEGCTAENVIVVCD